MNRRLERITIDPEEVEKVMRWVDDSGIDRGTDIDESDLIIFRLLGAKFDMSSVVFEVNRLSELTESDAS